MGAPCTTSPINKKEYITDIAQILIKNNGKKKYYKPEEVKDAHKQSKWYDGLDFSCWGMSTFSSHSDFDNYHQEVGETCDYIEMKTEMISGLSVTSSTDWSEIPDIDVDASWLDFGDIFEGIGEFIGGLFDGI